MIPSRSVLVRLRSSTVSLAGGLLLGFLVAVLFGAGPDVQAAAAAPTKAAAGKRAVPTKDAGKPAAPAKAAGSAAAPAKGKAAAPTPAPPAAPSPVAGGDDEDEAGEAAADGADPGPPTDGTPAQRDRWLADRIAAAIAARPALGPARIGVAVVDVGTGRAVYQRAADDAFNVASVTKVMTTGAALAVLGPEYRFPTLVYGEFDGKDTIKGDLYLKGSGDPTLTSAALWKMVVDLKLAGVRKVTGGVVIDDTAFDAVRWPPAYEQKTEDASYRAPIGAVALNSSVIVVLIQPGAAAGQPARVLLDPLSDYFVVKNTAMTVAKGRTALRVTAGPPAERPKDKKTEITVSGTIRVDAPPQRVKKRVEHPEHYAGATFARYLESYGIKVARRGLRFGAVPKTARALAGHLSDPVSLIVRELSKRSNNFIAEMLVKAMGAEAAGRPGTHANGLRAVADWLDGLGLEAGTYRMDNGSGLYDASRFSPRQVTTVLRAAWRDFRYGPDLAAALATAGADGTLRSRMVGTAGERYVRAKTGTLKGVVALAGYAGTANRQPLAFAVLVNDLPDRWEAGRAARSLQDEIAVLLVRYVESQAR